MLQQLKMDKKRNIKEHGLQEICKIQKQNLTMSVAWIKVNREKHTHSVYCDGQVTNGDYIVMNNYFFIEYKVYWYTH